MPGLGADRWRAELTTLTSTLASKVTADPTHDVPTCPGWTFRNLATHVGRGHRWAAHIVATRSAEFVPVNQVPDGRLPDAPQDQIIWLNNAAGLVIDTVSAAGTDPVWGLGPMRPATFWLRRRVHETLVHLADAQLAAGQRVEIAPDLAADAIDEWLDLIAARGDPADPASAGPAHGSVGADRSLHFHATDGGLGDGGEWTVFWQPNGVSVRPGHAKADVAVRGAAADLLLVLLRRLDKPAVEVIGDAAVFADWLSATPF